MRCQLMNGLLWKKGLNSERRQDGSANRTSFLDPDSSRNEGFRSFTRGVVLDYKSLDRVDRANLEGRGRAEPFAQCTCHGVLGIFDQELLERGVFGVERASSHACVEGAYPEDQEVGTEVHHLPRGFHAYGRAQMRFNLTTNHDQSEILACREDSANRRVLRRYCDFEFFGDHPRYGEIGGASVDVDELPLLDQRRQGRSKRSFAI